MSDPYSFRMPTHQRPINDGEREALVEAEEAAYEAVLEATAVAATEYALARVPDDLKGDERSDAVAQLQMKFTQAVLARMMTRVVGI